MEGEGEGAVGLADLEDGAVAVDAENGVVVELHLLLPIKRISMMTKKREPTTVFREAK